MNELRTSVLLAFQVNCLSLVGREVGGHLGRRQSLIIIC